MKIKIIFIWKQLKWTSTDVCLEAFMPAMKASTNICFKKADVSFMERKKMYQKQTPLTWVVGSDLSAILLENQILVIETENNQLTGHAQIISRDKMMTEDKKLRAELQKKPLIVLINKEAVNLNLK